MKKSLVLLTALLALSAFTFAQGKIALVFPQKIAENSVKGKDILAKLSALQDTKAKKYEALQKELDTLRKDAMNPALTQDARDKKTLEANAKETELKRFAEDAQRELASLRDNELGAMQRELIPLIEKIAKDEGYSLVIDSSTIGLAYADPALDITDKIIKAYDAQNAKPAAPAPKK